MTADPGATADDERAVALRDREIRYSTPHRERRPVLRRLQRFHREGYVRLSGTVRDEAAGDEDFACGGDDGAQLVPAVDELARLDRYMQRRTAVRRLPLRDEAVEPRPLGQPPDRHDEAASVVRGEQREASG